MSAFIREKKDFFAGMYDAQGHLVYTDHDKFGPGMVDCVLEVYPAATMAPGDVYWFSDCYLSRGAISHSPDMCFIAPAFDNGTLMGFAAAFGHFWDIGGIKPGTLSPLATEIFQEGIAIPPIKISDRGTFNEEAYRLILRNSRFPDLLRGDTRAMIAACTLGQRRLQELCQRFGREQLLAGFHAIFAQSERCIRSALTAVPDGHYAFADYVDSDCVSDKPFRVQVALKVHGDTVSVDFRDTDDQASGPINFLLHPDAARMMVTRFLSWKDPSVLLNHGAFEPVIDVLLRPGSLVQPRHPASLACVPTRCIACSTASWAISRRPPLGQLPPGLATTSSTCCAPSIPRVARSRCSSTVLVSVKARVPSAMAWTSSTRRVAREISPSSSSRANSPCRSSTTPSTKTAVARHLPRWRGRGPHVRVLTPKAILGTRMNGVKCPSWGVKGGKAGKSGYFVVNPGTPQERRIPPFGDNLELQYGDIVRVVTSGGGGWGNPAERDSLAARQDVKDGFVSLHSAREDYGVVIELTPGRSTGVRRKNAVLLGPPRHRCLTGGNSRADGEGSGRGT